MPAMGAIFNLCEEIASDGETLKILRECGTLDLFTPGSSADFDLKLSLTDDGRIDVEVEILGMHYDGFEMRFLFNPHVVEAEKGMHPIYGGDRLDKIAISLERTIRKSGSHGVTMREINRNHNFTFGKLSRDEKIWIIDALIGSHDIVMENVRRTSGRTVKVLRLRDCVVPKRKKRRSCDLI